MTRKTSGHVTKHRMKDYGDEEQSDTEDNGIGKHACYYVRGRNFREQKFSRFLRLLALFAKVFAKA